MANVEVSFQSYVGGVKANYEGEKTIFYSPIKIDRDGDQSFKGHRLMKIDEDKTVKISDYLVYREGKNTLVDYKKKERCIFILEEELSKNVNGIMVGKLSMKELRGIKEGMEFDFYNLIVYPRPGIKNPEQIMGIVKEIREAKEITNGLFWIEFNRITLVRRWDKDFSKKETLQEISEITSTVLIAPY